MSHHLTKKDLGKLTSKFHYDYFDNEKRDCDHLQFHSNIKDDLKNYSGRFNDISDKLIKGLCFIYNKKNDNPKQFDKKWCSYLYYWLGHNIFQNLSDKTLFPKIIDMIYYELNSSFSYDIFKPIYKDINEDTFNTYKLLFDYSKDHENINLSTSYGYTTCDEHYKKVMIDYINTYRDAHKNCTENNEKNYDCKYFEKLFTKDLYAKLSTFTCTERPYENVFLEVPINKDRELDKGVLVTPARLTDLHRTSVPKYHLDLEGSGYPRSYPHPYPNQGLADQHTLDGNSILPVEETTKGGSSKSIAGSVVPVLGVSSISLLLYKVTALGGFINKLLGRNSNMYNPIEDIDGFNPYSDGMDPGGRRMNISYHRL
ncbi:PIR protein [Plasmodium vivax]|uniref:VIR protein n=1 Tax=Plasmodium vivax TaxID=5855 RepID=A0A565A7B3_PLAVI|nr:PIR protein [Plasmodium vivax]